MNVIRIKFSARKIIGILCLTGILIISGCTTNPPSPTNDSAASSNLSGPTEQQRRSYRTALVALDSKDYLKAESLLVDLSDSNPELAGPWANLGLIRLIQKKPVEAEQYLLKALELNPKLTKALNLMGLIATHNKQLAKAESFFKQAIDNNDEYSNAHYNLALLYDIYLQDIRKAASHYRKYSELTQNTDKETLSWLEQLESTLKNQP